MRQGWVEGSGTIKMCVPTNALTFVLLTFREEINNGSFNICNNNSYGPPIPIIKLLRQTRIHIMMKEQTLN
jgi:hypothetical protein